MIYSTDGHKAVVELLIEAGADVEAKNFVRFDVARKSRSQRGIAGGLVIIKHDSKALVFLSILHTYNTLRLY